MKSDSDGHSLLDKARQQPEFLKAGLRKLLRARTRLLVCMLTLPVYMIALWMLLSNGREVDLFMYFYMALWGVFAIDMAIRKCPRCGNQFYVKSIWLNLITKTCVHCGLNKAEIEVGDTEEF